MALEQYRRKRSSGRTPEPFGSNSTPSPPASGSGLFVVQKHAARRLHYDFRLEMESVLRSWAVPKGPSLNPEDKRLAVAVEDHPLEYADFEGVIPQGNYGAGAVIVWDRGQYRVIDSHERQAAAAVRNGKLDIELDGYKLRGAFTLVRTRLGSASASEGRENWLLIKKRDSFAGAQDVTALDPRSVLSGLTIEEIADAPALEKRIAIELEREGAPTISGALEAKRFPLSLAKSVDEPFDNDDWLFEVKHDGVRALAIRDGARTRLFARSRAEITQAYPEITLSLDAVPFERFVIDGEIVAVGEDGRPNFQLLQQRMHVRDAAAAARLSRAIPVCYFVFDLLVFDRFDLRPLALETRKRFLARVARGEGSVRFCEHAIGRGRAFFDAVTESGIEGMMAKGRESPYRGVRSGDWLKIKCPLTRRFVIGAYSDPRGSRSRFGALLLGLWEPDGRLRFVGKVGTGFSEQALSRLYREMAARPLKSSPFRRSGASERQIPRRAHFCKPELVCEVRFSEVTDDGCVRHPVFVRTVADADPRACRWEAPFAAKTASGANVDRIEQIEPGRGKEKRAPNITNADKIFWPKARYTKGDLVRYYEAIAPWMLPYLKDRPVMIERFPDGIEGKSFIQKDAPGFAPQWIRTERIADDTGSAKNYLVIESREALAWVANLGAIPIHIWSSHAPHLERPVWLLFDLDPKGAATVAVVTVARQLIDVLGKLGLAAVIKTSGQAGLHVCVGLRPSYGYEETEKFCELVARLVASQIPELATTERAIPSRKGRVYIDYAQLGYGKTIAAPFAVRPLPGAPVSTPIRASELRKDLDPARFNIGTVARRMKRLRADPFIGALQDKQSLESALPRLGKLLKDEALLR